MLYPRIFCNQEEEDVEAQLERQLRQQFRLDAETSGQSGRVSMKNHSKRLARERDLDRPN